MKSTANVPSLLAAFALATAVSPLSLAAQAPLDLSGRWEIKDRAVVDSAADSAAADSVAQTPETEAPQPPQPPNRSAGPPGGGEGRGGGRPAGPPEEERRQLSLLLGMAQLVPSFELVQTDSTMRVTNEDGFSYTVHLDGRKTELPLTDSISVEVKGEWKNGSLVVEYKPQGGGKMTETYSLADSGVFLRLEVKVEHGLLRQPAWEPRMYRKMVDPGDRP